MNTALCINLFRDLNSRMSGPQQERAALFQASALPETVNLGRKLILGSSLNDRAGPAAATEGILKSRETENREIAHLHDLSNFSPLLLLPSPPSES